MERWLSALEATTREADESFSEIDTYESEHDTALIKQHIEKLAEIATTVADAAAVAKAGCAKQDELTKLAAELRATKEFHACTDKFTPKTQRGRAIEPSC